MTHTATAAVGTAMDMVTLGGNTVAVHSAGLGILAEHDVEGCAAVAVAAADLSWFAAAPAAAEVLLFVDGADEPTAVKTSAPAALLQGLSVKGRGFVLAALGDCSVAIIDVASASVVATGALPAVPAPSMMSAAVTSAVVPATASAAASASSGAASSAVTVAIVAIVVIRQTARVLRAELIADLPQLTNVRVRIR